MLPEEVKRNRKLITTGGSIPIQENHIYLRVWQGGTSALELNSSKISMSLNVTPHSQSGTKVRVYRILKIWMTFDKTEQCKKRKAYF